MARLAQSENRFQNLVRDATLGIVVLTGEEMLVEIVNESYARIVSRLLSELQNQPLFDLIPETEAEFRPLLENVKHTGTPLYLYDTPYFVFHNGKRKDGFLNLVYQPYREDDGTIIGVMALCQDVTEQVVARFKLKEADKMTGVTIEAAKLSAWHIEPQTKALVYNQTLATIFGYERQEAMSYEDAIGQVTDEYRPQIVAAIDQAITSGGDYDFTYQQYRFKDGEPIWLRSFGKISLDEDGHYRIFSGFVMDIMEQKEDEHIKMMLSEWSAMS